MLPCIEKKHTLAGEIQTYACELVHLDDNLGILKYVIDREYTVADVWLAPGDVTIALYWTDRPYTLYTWNPSGNGAIVYYFNIADRIVLSPQEFSWRDLAVDILVDGLGEAHILDEDDIPPALQPELRGHIEHAKNFVFSSYRDIIKEVESLVSSLHFRQTSEPEKVNWTRIKSDKSR